MQMRPTLITLPLLAVFCFVSFRTFTAVDDVGTSIPHDSVVDIELAAEMPARISRARPDQFYQPILDRPLFSPTRRRGQPDRIEPAQPLDADEIDPTDSEVPPNYILIGIVSIGDERVAILQPLEQTRSNQTDLLVRQGDFVEDWQVDIIQSDGVLLVLGDAKVILTKLE